MDYFVGHKATFSNTISEYDVYQFAGIARALIIANAIYSIYS